MILLKISQDDYRIELGLFKRKENAINFAQKIPGYRHEEELYEGVKFESDFIDYLEISDLDAEGEGIIESATKVDAYVFPNKEVKSYKEDTGYGS